MMIWRHCIRFLIYRSIYIIDMAYVYELYTPITRSLLYRLSSSIGQLSSPHFFLVRSSPYLRLFSCLPFLSPQSFWCLFSVAIFGSCSLMRNENMTSISCAYIIFIYSQPFHSLHTHPRRGISENMEESSISLIEIFSLTTLFLFQNRLGHQIETIQWEHQSQIATEFNGCP